MSDAQSVCMHAQSYVTLCDPMDCSPLGCFCPWIFQARILEWVAIFYSMGSSQCRDQTRLLHLLDWQVESLPQSQPIKYYHNYQKRHKERKMLS